MKGGAMGIFDKSQLVKTIRVLQKKDCPKTDGKHQLRKTLDGIRKKA